MQVLCGRGGVWVNAQVSPWPCLMTALGQYLYSFTRKVWPEKTDTYLFDFFVMADEEVEGSVLCYTKPR